MKICYLSDANSVHTKKWCSYFVKKGWEIHVISLNNGDIPGVFLHILDINLNNVREGSVLSKFSYIRKINRIKSIINEIKPDIVHAHYASSYGLLAALTKFHPYVLSVWGSDVYDFPKKGRIFKEIIKFNLSKADVILSTSKVMAEETKRYTGKNIEITPFGVDIDLFKPAEKIDGNYIRIGTVKSLEEKYGIKYLIKAFSKVSKEFSNLKLIIAGSGSQLLFLQQLTKKLKLEDKVTFLGQINQSEVIRTLQKLDIAVFPSTLDSESFGVAAVEAEACGIPVIVSDVGGLPEATKQGYSSLLVQKESEDSLYEALKLLIIDENKRKEMGRNARKFVLQNYDIRDNFLKVENIYNDLLIRSKK